jgi:hypothetical protein
MATTLLGGKYIIEKDGNGFILKEKIVYQVKDKNTGEMVNKERYDNTYYGNYKNALIAVVKNAPKDAKDITEVLEIMKRIEDKIINSNKI